MAVVSSDVVTRIVHPMTAGVRAGWTVFVAALVVPAARDGRPGPDAVRRLTRRFSLFSKAAPLVALLSGTYVVGRGCPADRCSPE